MIEMNKLLYRSQARFYLGEAEEQAQYVFQLREGAPKELRRSFIISLDKDTTPSGSAVEVARELKEIIDSYWINTDTNAIAKLVEYLEKWAEVDEYEGLLAEKASIKERLAEIDNRLGGFDPEEIAKMTAQCPTCFGGGWLGLDNFGDVQDFECPTCKGEGVCEHEQGD